MSNRVRSSEQNSEPGEKGFSRLSPPKSFRSLRSGRLGDKPKGLSTVIRSKRVERYRGAKTRPFAYPPSLCVVQFRCESLLQISCGRGLVPGGSVPLG
jgi:hypothetical protein